MSEDRVQTDYSPGDPVEEYKDISEHIRFYGNMRFGTLTIFVALTGGLIALVFGKDSLSPPLTPFPDSWIFSPRFALKLSGLLIASAFWVMEERTIAHADTLRERAKCLESRLGYRQYTDPVKKILPDRKLSTWRKQSASKDFFTATNAIRALYLGVSIFWLATVISTLVIDWTP